MKVTLQIEATLCLFICMINNILTDLKYKNKNY